MTIRPISRGVSDRLARLGAERAVASMGELVHDRLERADYNDMHRAARATRHQVIDRRDAAGQRAIRRTGQCREFIRAVNETGPVLSAQSRPPRQHRAHPDPRP